jgi:hypothetical protein
MTSNTKDATIREVLAVMQELYLDPDCPPATRLKAAETVLNYYAKVPVEKPKEAEDDSSQEDFLELLKTLKES